MYFMCIRYSVYAPMDPGDRLVLNSERPVAAQSRGEKDERDSILSHYSNNNKNKQ